MASLPDQTKLVGLGLSHRNLDLLRKGKPIKIKGADIALPGIEILLFAGSTEKAMADQLDPYISAHTIIHKCQL